MATLIDAYASAHELGYTLPTVADGDLLVVAVNRDTSFNVSYTPTSFLTSLVSVGGVSVWTRTLASGDSAELLERTLSADSAAWYVAWVVRDVGAPFDQVLFGSEDNLVSSVSFPRTVDDNNAQGTPPFPSGVHLGAGFAFYAPTSGTPGTFGEARITDTDGYAVEASDTFEFVSGATGRNTSHAATAIADLSGNPDPITWEYTVSVGGPRTRLELVRIIFAAEDSYVGMLGAPL